MPFTYEIPPGGLNLFAFLMLFGGAGLLSITAPMLAKKAQAHLKTLVVGTILALCLVVFGAVLLTLPNLNSPAPGANPPLDTTATAAWQAVVDAGVAATQTAQVSSTSAP